MRGSRNKGGVVLIDKVKWDKWKSGPHDANILYSISKLVFERKEPDFYFETKDIVKEIHCRKATITQRLKAFTELGLIVQWNRGLYYLSAGPLELYQVTQDRRFLQFNIHEKHVILLNPERRKESAKSTIELFPNKYVKED